MTFSDSELLALAAINVRAPKLQQSRQSELIEEFGRTERVKLWKRRERTSFRRVRKLNVVAA